MNPANTRFELIRRCLDGEANGDEYAQLEELLRTDPEFRTDYVRYINVDAALAALPKQADDELQRGGKTEQRRGEMEQPPFPNRTVGMPRVRVLTGWVATVAVAILVGLFIHWRMEIGQVRAPQLAGTDASETANVNDAGIVVLTRVTGLTGTATADWRAGQTIPPGSMAWDTGLIQLEFYGGATVVVEGPAEIELLDESRMICRTGRLRAHVPEPARGFAVLAPSFELVDLGTEFGLNVHNDGAAEVHVFDGKVELYDVKSNRRLASRRELNAGEALTVDREGNSKPTIVRDAEFITPSGLSTLTDAQRQVQLRDWQSFRDSLKDDPRVVAYFPFDRHDVEDRLLMGNGANRTNIEGAIVGCEWAEGCWPGKSSLQFKRPGDRVRITIPGEFEALTYSTWVRVDGLDQSRNSLIMTDGFGKNGIHWQIRIDGSLTLGMRYANARARNYPTRPIFNAFRLGQWVHLATVYDNANSRVTHFVNGVPAHRQRLTRFASGSLKIGNASIGNWSGRGASDVRNLNGCMDELIVFGEALDEQEVHRIYEVGRP